MARVAGTRTMPRSVLANTQRFDLRLHAGLSLNGSSWAVSYAAASDSILVELVCIEDFSSAEHVVGSAVEFGGEHRERFALAVLFLEPLVQLLCSRVGPQERGGELPERPLQ